MKFKLVEDLTPEQEQEINKIIDNVYDEMSLLIEDDIDSFTMNSYDDSDTRYYFWLRDIRRLYDSLKLDKTFTDDAEGYESLWLLVCEKAKKNLWNNSDDADEYLLDDDDEVYAISDSCAKGIALSGVDDLIAEYLYDMYEDEEIEDDIKVIEEDWTDNYLDGEGNLQQNANVDEYNHIDDILLNMGTWCNEALEPFIEDYPETYESLFCKTSIDDFISTLNSSDIIDYDKYAYDYTEEVLVPDDLKEKIVNAIKTNLEAAFSNTSCLHRNDIWSHIWYEKVDIEELVANYIINDTFVDLDNVRTIDESVINTYEFIVINRDDSHYKDTIKAYSLSQAKFLAQKTHKGCLIRDLHQTTFNEDPDGEQLKMF